MPAVCQAPSCVPFTSPHGGNIIAYEVFYKHPAYALCLLLIHSTHIISLSHQGNIVRWLLQVLKERPRGVESLAEVTQLAGGRAGY